MEDIFSGPYDEIELIQQKCVKETFKNPKVSIIIPAYNTEKYIFKCLYSLIAQTLKEIEIIVINDGSTDSTPFIIKKFSDADGRIKIITQSNQKQGAARNAGVKIASGEYVGFVDSDDWVDSNYFEKLYNAATKYNSDIALATNVRIGNGKTKKRLNIIEEVFVTSLQEKIDISRQVKNPCPTNKIYKREMLEKNNVVWPEGVYCEDKLFTMQAIYYANGLVTVPDVNYYYFRNPNSTVNSKKQKKSKILIQHKNLARRAVLEFLKEKDVHIRDKEFWAVKKEYKILGLSIYKILESLHSERHVLLSFIKIRERNL